jgi:hypothetical protein
MNTAIGVLNQPEGENSWVDSNEKSQLNYNKLDYSGGQKNKLPNSQILNNGPPKPDAHNEIIKKPPMSNDRYKPSRNEPYDDREYPFKCVKDGLYANVMNGCRTFFQCANSGTPDEIKAHQKCPPNLFFNKALNRCDWSTDIKECLN